MVSDTPNNSENVPSMGRNQGILGRNMWMSLIIALYLLKNVHLLKLSDCESFRITGAFFTVA